MDIKLLPKLIEIKKQEISVLKADWLTLDQIVRSLESDYLIKVNFINDFIAYANEHRSISSVGAILSGRLFLQDLYSQRSEFQLDLNKAETQRNAAFESLKIAGGELRVLEKMMEKKLRLRHDTYLNFHQLNDDAIALTGYNKEKTLV